MSDKQMLQPKQELILIEELKSKYMTPAAVYSGVIAMMNWKKGKSVTQREYQNAVTKFLHGNGKGINNA